MDTRRISDRSFCYVKDLQRPTRPFVVALHLTQELETVVPRPDSRFQHEYRPEMALETSPYLE